mmetsp:Transcript_13092/g.36832  ORF Transcript_13092/g.36832 Transcript_13092/m.36832 type:complete len:128 (+) Transcript_13092:358-741(+)|eukprot:CAMPEP_0172361400 /NCGR_PEP_ID=MMETSP1060-20121228/5237_1 /TAXON_ID=37318 /ORGANISM="Pseudo-nitzschia pungens, Strain cf. cingulata" /LENGTH=127 /DNA_ID=CAMNT_0013083643 /DNA_START=294 /DNA_END=677 /DNA_ORIENTATION=+
MISSAAASRIVFRNSAIVGRRCLSTQGQEALGRLKDALEQYRAQNYQQELPSRFKKEMVVQCHRTAALVESKSSDDGAVAVEGIERLLQNIGVFGNQVSHDDVEVIVKELGDEETAKSADKILQKVL